MRHSSRSVLRVRRILRLAFIDGDEVSLRLTGVELSRAPDLDAALLVHHLSPVSEPTDDSGNGEEDGEEVHWEAWVEEKC